MRNYEQLKHLKNIRKRWYIIAIVSLVLLLIDISLLWGIQQYFPDIWEKETKILDTKVEASDEQHAISNALKNIELHSSYAILIDLEDYQTLYEKGADEKIYPASLTKVLTAVVALDAISNLQSKGEVQEKDLAGLWEENAYVVGLKAGDVLTYEQALYALILSSGADAANFLANNLAKDTPSFVEEMNKKANTLGMLQTHFTNTIGLHNDQHYTTLNEMKMMMVHALKNPVFKKMMSTLNYTIEGLASHPDGMEIKSSLLKYGGDITFEGGEIIGGKSGYTPEAQCCLISIARMDDGHMYMMISAKAGGDPVGDHNHIKDAKKVYEAIASTR
ncbi:D-alanyl-D-alanine carboxypeptidase family protein [Amedibacillus sp. YH-ame6]